MARRPIVRTQTPKQQYGKTWWGEQFLKALSDIDFENRLPRGKSYANNGAVSMLEYAENQILATVEGSRTQPYKVRIVFQPFADKSGKAFIQQLSAHPALISHLLNKELVPAIHAIATKEGLKIFPEKWSDIKMTCSCPDWAVPCKHIAAVIYRISAEIDHNPFLLFELRGLDLPTLLKDKGIQLQQIRQQIPKMEDLYPAKEISKAQSTQSEAKKYIPVPLIPLPNLVEPITSLMDPKPLFHAGTGDFRDVYTKQLKYIARTAQRLVSAGTGIDTLAKSKPKWKNAILAKYDIYIEVDRANHPYFLADGHPIPFVQLSEYLFDAEADSMSRRHPSQRFLHDALLFSLQMLASGTVVPRIMELPLQKYGIRWLPAMLHPQIRETLKSLSANLPENFLRLEDGPPVAGSPEELTILVLSLLLNDQMVFMSTLTDLDPLARFFFQGSVSTFSRPGEREIPASIHAWLERLHYFDSPFKVQLHLTEKTTETFTLDLMLQDAAAKNDPFPVSGLFTRKKLEDIRMDVLKSLTKLNSFIPKLDDYLNDKGKKPIVLQMEDLPDFLLRMVPAMQLMDISVLLPRSLQQLHRPRSTIRIRQEGSDVRHISMSDLLAFDWQIAIGDQTIDQKTFEKLTRKAHGLIRMKTGFMFATPEDIERIKRDLTDKRQFSAGELLTYALSENYEGSPVVLTDQVRKLIRKLTEYPEIPLPKGLNAQLRPYQER